MRLTSYGYLLIGLCCFAIVWTLLTGDWTVLLGVPAGLLLVKCISAEPLPRLVRRTNSTRTTNDG